MLFRRTEEQPATSTAAVQATEPRREEPILGSCHVALLGAWPVEVIEAQWGKPFPANCPPDPPRNSKTNQDRQLAVSGIRASCFSKDNAFTRRVTGNVNYLSVVGYFKVSASVKKVFQCLVKKNRNVAKLLISLFWFITFSLRIYQQNRKNNCFKKIFSHIEFLSFLNF